MTIFEKIKEMDIDTFAAWLKENGTHEDSSWIKWWDENYCQKCKCEIVKVVDSDEKIQCSWCELYDNCRFFQEVDYVPNTKDIIKMWLQKGEEIAMLSNNTTVNSEDILPSLSELYAVPKTYEEEMIEQDKMDSAVSFLENMNIRVKDKYGYYRTSYAILRDLGEYLSKNNG